MVYAKEALLGALIMSLVASSIFIGYINVTATTGDFPDLGPSNIPGAIVFPDLGGLQGGTTSGQDYTTASGYSQNISTLSGTWTRADGIGYTLTSPAFLAVSVIALENVQSTNNIYTVNAKVENVPGNKFYVFPRYITGFSGSDIEVVFDNDGVHIPKFPLTAGFIGAGDDYFLPMSNSETTLSGGSTITTILTEATSPQNSNTPDYTAKLTVIKDGQTLFTTPIRSLLPGFYPSSEVRHAAAGSDSTGFIIQSFPNTLVQDTAQVVVSGTTGIGWLDSIFNAGFGAYNTVTKLAGVLGTILGFSTGALIPPYGVAFIIAPQLIVIWFIAAQLIRGTG